MLISIFQKTVILLSVFCVIIKVIKFKVINGSYNLVINMF